MLIRKTDFLKRYNQNMIAAFMLEGRLMGAEKMMGEEGKEKRGGETGRKLGEGKRKRVNRKKWGRGEREREWEKTERMGGKDRENERKLKEGAGKIERMRENG